jgi:hypothetical protein
VLPLKGALVFRKKSFKAGKEELLGHSSVKVTERYTHPNQALKREAVELLVAGNEAVGRGRLSQERHTEGERPDDLSETHSVAIN